MNPTYDGVEYEHWMDGLKSMRDHNIKHILATFAYFGIPESFLDVGCGEGVTVEIARRLGINAFGVDQLVQDDWPDHFFHQNLVDAFRLPSQVEMVYSLEVAEHLHDSAHSTFCDTLVENMLEKDAHLIFSAAPPGQDGTGHVALRPAIYWRREFTNRGLTYSRIKTTELALLWNNIVSPLGHLSSNLQVFER